MNVFAAKPILRGTYGGFHYYYVVYAVLKFLYHTPTRYVETILK